MKLHRFLVRLALSSAHVFVWIFAFHYFYLKNVSLTEALSATALTYALTHLLVILITPFSARALRHGARGMLIRASIFLSLAFAAMGAAFANVLDSMEWGILLFAVFFALYRAWYWIPYKTHAEGSIRLSTALEVTLALTPAFVGIGLAAFSYAPIILLAAASLIALIAAIPAHRMHDTHEGYSLGYRATFHELFATNNRRMLLGALCTGFEGAALLFMWPIVVFTLVGWSYAMFGIVLSLTFILTMVIRMLFLHFAWGVRSPYVQSVLTIATWIIRGTIAAPLSIVLVDTSYHTGASMGRSIDARSFEQAADSHTFIDEYTALKEIGLSLGRILFALLIVHLAGVASFPIIVLSMLGLAAVCGVISILFSHRSKRVAF